MDDTGRPRHRAMALVALAVGAVGLIAGSLIEQARNSGQRSPGTPEGISRFVMTLSDPVLPSTRSSMALSPDGGLLAYLSSPSGKGLTGTLYFRPLDRLSSTPIEGTDGSQALFFSPDGEWIAFWAGTQLKKVSVRGGLPELIGPVRDFQSGSWGPDGLIVFSDGAKLETIAVPEGGSEPHVGRPDWMADVASPEGRSPHFLPSGRHVLYQSREGSVAIWSLQTGEQRIVLPQGQNPRYLESGHLLVVQRTTVLAVPFDLDSLSTVGPAVPVLENVRRNVDRGGDADLAVSRSGQLLYVRSDQSSDTLMWIDRTGQSTPVDLNIKRFWEPRVSPDGNKIALTLRGEEPSQVGFVDLERGNLVVPLTEHGGRSPRWSPSGDLIAFESRRGGDYLNVFVVPIDASRPPEGLTQGAPSKFLNSLSTGGVLWSENDEHTRTDLWGLRLDRSSSPFPVAATEDFDSGASFSPDGKWVAWSRFALPQSRILVASFPDLEQPRTIATSAVCPVWSRSTNELFYYDMVGDRMMVVTYRTSAEEGPSTFEHSTPEPLFDVEFVVSADAARPNFDVHPDGQRFLAIQRPTQPSREIHVVQNWFLELERLVPTR